ncbi:prephenate dehydrogenase [Vulcanibacillus modesticaldus]|uniref:Prephenate dehydrogenase n=1 Tax=Vulcanibacillus modesticaldus TaxID=337097 RepID=A0A1D2YUN6_9BACI|nr:prephenate dehydrogenase [Vulcanibacillus modesticaldus]OEF99346.1 prephenate dehydrogenase [Vulcanibacillus modesticaldus]
MEISELKITIVGLGLIGGSFSMALRELKPKKLWAVDINQDVLKMAETQGIIDRGFLKPNIPLKNSDVVIISLYPEQTVNFIKNNLNNFKRGAVITDTTGIKDKILTEINNFIRDDLEFIGGHPMAGKEAMGFEFASAEIFKGANYILTPTDKNKEENIKLIEKIVMGIGCKNLIKISPKKHDEIIAYTSQMPHILALALVNSNHIDGLGLFVGDSFRAITRVANINARLWAELLIKNKDNILGQIKSFEDSLINIKKSVMEMDSDGLRRIFEKGSDMRDILWRL